MGFASTSLVFIVVMVATFNVSSLTTATYDVGDTSGWINMGNIDYDKWSSSKLFMLVTQFVNFRFAITILSYNPKFHNVLQVTSQDYDVHHNICISYRKVGQKVDIRVSTSSRQVTKNSSTCYYDPCSSTPSLPITPTFSNPLPLPLPADMVFTPPTIISFASNSLSNRLFF
ncbi:hypothetical protein MKW94_007449 [Papaver nudicaule]|uniref:Phytocyanin domain-containing protein n=1 Tax=Papaver nudicaule TaxID=74823 RepID=A0AA41RXS8_PAPNU|nr:hypothetical protein [Papaver nudicaule]